MYAKRPNVKVKMTGRFRVSYRSIVQPCRQCSRIRILRFFQISKKTWLYVFLKWPVKKNVKSR